VKYVSEKKNYVFKRIVHSADSVLTAPKDVLLTNFLYYFYHFYNNWKRRIYRHIVMH